MKTKRLSMRSLALLLAMIMLASCVIALPTAAVDIEEEIKPDFLWELDFEKMSSITDNMESTQYTLQTPGGGNKIAMTQFESRNVLGIKDGAGQYYIVDNGNILDDYDTFSIEADMYFEAYPSGSAGGKTSHEYPMSFVTWITQNDGGSDSYRSIRIDDEGYLCTGTNPVNKPEQKSEAKLPLGEWFNIRFLISPLTGFCEVYINGQNLLSYKIGSPKNMTKSIIRFFDIRYQYSVYFSNISVYSDSSYRIGLTEEETADYLAYQTTKIENGKFDLRVVSGTNIENLADYNRTGFMVTTLWEENGKVVAEEQDVNITTVYESLLAAGNTVKASDLGVKYIAPIPVKGIDASVGHVEIVVRPYIKKDGMRIFGDAMILTWAGDTKDGYPVLNMAERSVEYTALPSDDTYTRINTQDNYANATTMSIKNNGESSDTTRKAYIKFTFSEIAIKRLLTSSRIYLEFYPTSVRTLNEEETAEGGVLADVMGVGTDWTEDILTGRNDTKLAPVLEWIGDVRYQKNQYAKIDVTEYVLAHASEGAVAFKIENVESDGASGELKIASSEASSGSPKLTVYPILYNHEINLGKLKNAGYEPWGYAEKLVNEWFKSGYDSIYSKTYDTIDLDAVDNTQPTGDYTIKSEWKSNSPSDKWNSKVYARSIDTLTGFTKGATSEYDEYGGITNSGIKGQATGYFHTEKIGVRTYIIDPIGNPFFAVGINTIQLGSTENQKQASIEKYGSEENFYKEVSQTLRDIGINTYHGGDAQFFAEQKLSTAIGLGCISGYMGNGSAGLGLSVSTGGSASFLHNNTMNVFDPDFITYCNTNVATKIEPYKDSPYVLGFYSDNEIPSESDMLYRYLTIDPTEPVNAFSYAAAWTWLIKATGNPNASTADITPELSEEFKAFVYDRYFKVVTDAIDVAGGGNYMYLGNRIHSTNRTSEGYLRAASKYVDVLTVNLYGGLEPPIETIKTMYKYSGKPFIVTEFFAKADDAVDMNGYSLGNQTNAGWIVKTQEDRAIHYENYALLLLESQTCVGWTWYRFRDNDQTIYQDAVGNLYRAYDYKNGTISQFMNLETGALIDGPGLAPSLTVYYKGESDTSNLGSNKGIFDNKMNIYEELTSTIELVSDNIFSIINYFDNLHK